MRKETIDNLKLDKDQSHLQDPRSSLYRSLHLGDKSQARELLWKSIGEKELFSDQEWDRLYQRAGGVDEGDRFQAMRSDL